MLVAIKHTVIFKNKISGLKIVTSQQTPSVGYTVSQIQVYDVMLVVRL